MSNTKEIYLTEAGLEAKKKELEELKLVRRPEVINALKEARALGDLSENAEYDAARNLQAEVEGKIKELEVMIDKAIIVTDVDKNKVSIGSTVKLEYVEDNDTDIYSIVGSSEADPFENKISNESPIAQAILGKKENDKVTVDSPNGSFDIEIVKVA